MNTGSTDRAVDRVGAGLGVDVPQVDEEDAMVALNFSNVRRTAGFGGGAGGFWASTGAGNIARPATAYAMASRVMAVSVGAIKVIRSDDVAIRSIAAALASYCNHARSADLSIDSSSRLLAVHPPT